MLPVATNHQVACRLLLTGDLISAQVGGWLGLVQIRGWLLVLCDCVRVLLI
jgi:hypothetical protein